MIFNSQTHKSELSLSLADAIAHFRYKDGGEMYLVRLEEGLHLLSFDKNGFCNNASGHTNIRDAWFWVAMGVVADLGMEDLADQMYARKGSHEFAA